jgi:hypothetical protein
MGATYLGKRVRARLGLKSGERLVRSSKAGRLSFQRLTNWQVDEMSWHQKSLCICILTAPSPYSLHHDVSSTASTPPTSPIPSHPSLPQALPVPLDTVSQCHLNH